MSECQCQHCIMPGPRNFSMHVFHVRLLKCVHRTSKIGTYILERYMCTGNFNPGKQYDTYEEAVKHLTKLGFISD